MRFRKPRAQRISTGTIGDHGSNGYKIESEPTGHFRLSHKWNWESFLLEQLLAKIRLEGGVAIADASSGIASTLLTGGQLNTLRVVDSKDEFNSTNPIKFSPMMHRSCIEAVDRTFRDIMDSDREPFGGK
ncbi:Helitron helicase [Phytophthora megakarya]|uniref:Helitron helicase n=1 Tax=Phytophthora megakarya TaxID=4795 RepID=A0A225X1Z5_9STRA|nr:Helitron helicase [Phytophthora megakarya]